MSTSAESFTNDFLNSAVRPHSQHEELEPSIMWRVLDEIDYGLILVSPEGRLQHANHLGRYELAQAKFIRLASEGLNNTHCAAKQQLQANNASATADILNGISAAAQGRRQMLTLHLGTERLSMACVPLFQAFEGPCSSVLLMLARKKELANLALGFFARSHKLTSAEENVLSALCQGQQIADIATHNQVAESTVRTQIRALREKTQCNSIRLLVQQIATLPPVIPVCLYVQTTNQQAHDA